MFQKIAKHRANDASNDVHRPPLHGCPPRDCSTAEKDGRRRETRHGHASPDVRESKN